MSTDIRYVHRLLRTTCSVNLVYNFQILKFDKLNKKNHVKTKKKFDEFVNGSKIALEHFEIFTTSRKLLI